MLTYQLLDSANFVQRSDGVLIPTDPANRDYADYLAWKAAGGTPTAVPLQFYKDKQSAQINASCQQAIFNGFSSSATGAARSYPAKSLDQQNLTASVTDALVALAAAPWAASTPYVQGAVVVMGGQAYSCTTAGTSGAAAPAWPAAPGTSVADGTAAWQIWTTPFWSADALGTWAYSSHTAAQIKQAGRDGKAAILANLQKCQGYLSQISAATTVAAVQAVVWV